jgi:hypothetical protein
VFEKKRAIILMLELFIFFPCISLHLLLCLGGGLRWQLGFAGEDFIYFFEQIYNGCYCSDFIMCFLLLVFTSCIPLRR